MFIVGYATIDEIEELTRRGWEVEDAEEYGLVGDDDLMAYPESPDTKAIVIFVDASVIDVMSGPDWDLG